MLHFGVQLLVQFSSNQVEPRDFYENMIEQAQLAEKYGFDSVWIGEHHVINSARFPQIATLSALACATKKVQIGQSVVLLPLYHPLMIAENLAMIDVISHGRLIAGFASGYRKEEYDAFGIPIRGRGKRLEECLEILKRLWTLKDVTFHGKYYDFDHIWIDPKPVQKPRPKIVLGASNEVAVKRAALAGDGWLMQGWLPPNTLHNQLDVYNETMKQRKYPDDPETDRIIGLVTESYASTDGDKARDLCKPGIMGKFRENVNWGERWFGDSDAGFDEVKDRFIIGNADECINQIDAKRANYGITHFILRFQLPGLTGAQANEAIRFFGDRVLPYFKAR